MERRRFECVFCKSIFSDEWNLKTHVERVHERKKAFDCEICDSSFKKEGSLKDHFSRIHEGNRPLKYVICRSSFEKRQPLSWHISAVHQMWIEKPNKSVNSLVISMNIVSPEIKFCKITLDMLMTNHL